VRVAGHTHPHSLAVRRPSRLSHPVRLRLSTQKPGMRSSVGSPRGETLLRIPGICGASRTPHGESSGFQRRSRSTAARHVVITRWCRGAWPPARHVAITPSWRGTSSPPRTPRRRAARRRSRRA
jgi:hypothetical protein